MILYRPINGWKDAGRELFDMWAESNYCEIRDTRHNCLWAREIGDVLLYERPRLEFLPTVWNIGLFANTQHNGNNSYPWIFWPRRPRLLENMLTENLPTYDERDNESIFLGRIENNVQDKNRTQHDWSTCISLFSMPKSQSFYPYTQLDYLHKVKASKFGLVLPGYGPKCNREIELMGLGTVPIFTPNVETRYHNPIEKDKHYLYANNPEEVKDCIRNCSKEKWEYISNECKIWYNINCSRKGSFETTVKIIEEKSNA